MSDRLTARQQRFVDCYDGNATDAARQAGYAGGENALASKGSQLLRNAKVAESIKARQEAENAPLIADRQARQRFWTETMQDDQGDMKDRLKASELLGRSEADFIERHEHSGPDGGSIEMDAGEQAMKLAGLLTKIQRRVDDGE